MKIFAQNIIRVSCLLLQSSPKIANPKWTIKLPVDKAFMALRRIIVSLGLLAIVAGAVLLLWPAKAVPKQSAERHHSSSFPVQSFAFTYTSQSYLNPTLPGSQTSGQGLTIACESKGLMHLKGTGAERFALLFEFTDVLCGGANVISERGLARTVHYTREYLTSTIAVQRATEDPALAIARSLFLHMDLGLRAEWPDATQNQGHEERRLEGDLVPAMDWVMDQGLVQWTKKFSGVLPSENTAAGLTQSLQYHVGGRSEISKPIEWGLVQLDGSEQSITMQKKNLVARTDIQIRLQRSAPLNNDHTRALWAETRANIPAAAPKMLSAEEKQNLLQRWRQFRDGEGQKPARGASESNQEEYLELKQALRDDPTLADELAEDLREMDPVSSAFATLSGAMIYSGEAEALKVFVAQAMSHKDDAAWQQRALPMIGLAPGPTAQSWKYLDAMRQEAKQPELKVAAELGMATHLKRGYQDPAFITEIQDRMQSAQTEEARLHLLDVVGNAGLDQLFPLVSSWLSGASLPLRLRIVQALRFMQRPEAEALLLQLAADPNMDMALMALQSLRDRTVMASSIPVLLRLLSTSSDDRVRLKILENLYDARHQDAELLKKVQRIRSGLSMSAALTAAWDQLEKDWVDPVET